MAQYIDKAAVVAEIEKLKYVIMPYPTMAEKVAYRDGIEDTIKIVIKSLEVKGVDLELNSFDATVCKIGNSYLKEMDKNAIVKALEPYKDGDKVKVIIKAQKGD